MGPREIVDAALIKSAKFNLQDWLANGIKPEIRDAAIGTIGGGLLGGIGNAATGGSFWSGALGGGLLGGLGGYFRKPLMGFASQLLPTKKPAGKPTAPAGNIPDSTAAKATASVTPNLHPKGQTPSHDYTDSAARFNKQQLLA